MTADTTTAPATSRHRKRAPDGRTLRRAEVLLRRSQLQLEPEVPFEQAVAMLARVLQRNDPFASDHGRLLVAALRARSRKERRAGPRPPPEAAVRRLLAQGQAPWPAAVAAAVDRHQAYQQARGRRLVRLAPTAVRDGPRAARYVADHWRALNRAPTPNHLGKALGWDAHSTWTVIHLLVDLGWLAVDDRQLQPGPRARGQTPAPAGRPPPLRSGRPGVR